MTQQMVISFIKSFRTFQHSSHHAQKIAFNKLPQNIHVPISFLPEAVFHTDPYIFMLKNMMYAFVPKSNGEI